MSSASSAALAREIQLANAQLNRVNGLPKTTNDLSAWKYQQHVGRLLNTSSRKAIDSLQTNTVVHHGIGQVRAFAESRRSSLTTTRSSKQTLAEKPQKPQPAQTRGSCSTKEGHSANFKVLNQQSPAFAREYQLALTNKRLLMPRMNALELDEEMPSWFTAVDEKEFDRLQFREIMEADTARMAERRKNQNHLAFAGPSTSVSNMTFPNVRTSLSASHTAPVHFSDQVATRSSDEPAEAPVQRRGKQLRAQQMDKAIKKRLDLALHNHEQKNASRASQKSRDAANRKVASQHTGPIVKGLRRPPFAVETALVQSEEPVHYELGDSAVQNDEALGDQEEQFAWWSKYWADKLNPTEMNVPIHPVEKMWRGNFQKRPIPWRKEQLGSFPAYNDFPWPPPGQSDETKRQMATFFDSKAPFGCDQDRFRGPQELPMNTIMRDQKNIPDFIDPQGDLRDTFTTRPLGQSWRSHATVGWLGYKQENPRERYDPINRRIYTEQFERILGIVADKLEAHGVSNFSHAFGAFDHDKSGYIDQTELQAFLAKYNILLKEDEYEALINSFEDDEQDRRISYTEFVSAIEGKARRHPLRVNYGTRGAGASIPRYTRS